MNRPLIGEVLSRMGRLSAIDINEILSEQAVTRQRFGEIAISWGLCEAEHIRDAWCSQLADGCQRLELSSLGIDESAVACISAEAARQMRIMPIRFLGDQLIIATSRLIEAKEATMISQLAGREIRFVKAEANEIERAIESHYAQAA